MLLLMMIMASRKKKIHVLAEVKESNFVLNLEMHLFSMPSYCCYLTAATKCLSAWDDGGLRGRRTYKSLGVSQ